VAGKKDPTTEANKILSQVNENLERQEESLRMVSTSFVKRGDYTLAIIHGQTFDPIKPTVIIGYGFSKRHPDDDSDRSVGHQYAFERALSDVFDVYKKAKARAAQAVLW